MSGVVVRENPFPMELMEEALEGDNNGYIEGVVAVELSDIIDRDFDGFLDLLSEKLTGTELLMDINYQVVGHDENILFINVRGDVSDIVTCNNIDNYEV